MAWPPSRKRAHSETGARAHRWVEKHQRDGFALQRIAQLAAFEFRRLHQQGIKVGAAPVLGIEEVLHVARVRKSEGGQNAKNPAARLGFGKCGA